MRAWLPVIGIWDLRFGIWNLRFSPRGFSPMTCRELVELLIDFVSDDMPAEHRARLEQHLRRCPPCEAYLASYRMTIRLTRQLPCEPLPPELEARLRAALKEFRQGDSPCQEV
jgi:anti-sigma factor RsiW